MSKNGGRETYILGYPTKHNSVIGDGDAKALASPDHEFIVVSYRVSCIA